MIGRTVVALTVIASAAYGAFVPVKAVGTDVPLLNCTEAAVNINSSELDATVFHQSGLVTPLHVCLELGAAATVCSGATTVTGTLEASTTTTTGTPPTLEITLELVAGTKNFCTEIPVCKVLKFHRDAAASLGVALNVIKYTAKLPVKLDTDGSLGKTAIYGGAITVGTTTSTTETVAFTPGYGVMYTQDAGCNAGQSCTSSVVSTANYVKTAQMVLFNDMNDFTLCEADSATGSTISTHLADIYVAPSAGVDACMTGTTCDSELTVTVATTTSTSTASTASTATGTGTETSSAPMHIASVLVAASTAIIFM